MVKKLDVAIVKVPLDRKPVNYPQEFPKAPRLYLELIENKDKIKQDLINKEYVMTSSPKELPHKQEQEHYKHDRSQSSQSSTTSSSSASTASSFKNRSKNSSVSGDSDELYARLKELLEEESSVSTSKTENYQRASAKADGEEIKERKDSRRRSRDDKYSVHRDRSGNSIKVQEYTTAPTLAELEAKGGYVPKKEYRDVTQDSYENDDDKRELLFKFDLLKKSYPLASIPEYTIHTDITTMRKSYEDTLHRLTLDSTVDSYKMYLKYAFLGVEYACGHFLGLDMQGFTQQQLISMHTYEKLLIELGEKNYIPDSQSRWPVEIRLLFMVLINAAFFVVSKSIMKNTGTNLMNILNNADMASKKNRKMKGPDIDFDEI